MDDKKKKEKKPDHPFDKWPPLRNEIVDEEDREKKPRNVSYKDPEEYHLAPEEPIYETDEAKQLVEQDDKDDEDEDEDKD